MARMTNKQRRAFFTRLINPYIMEPVECEEISENEPLPEIDTEINNIRFNKNTPACYSSYHNGIGLDGMTLEEVAQVEGVTRERIRQIEAKALRKLKNPKVSKHLRIFLTA